MDNDAVTQQTHQSERETFRAMIEAHQDAGTCYICGKAVEKFAAKHGATGAHWDCFSGVKAAVAADMAKTPVRNRPRRVRRGHGATVQELERRVATALGTYFGTKVVAVTVYLAPPVWCQARFDVLKFTGTAQVEDGLPIQFGSWATATALIRSKEWAVTPAHESNSGYVELSP